MISKLKKKNIKILKISSYYNTNEKVLWKNESKNDVDLKKKNIW